MSDKSQRKNRHTVSEAHGEFVTSLCPARTMFAVMSAFMFAIVYGMNVALSVTIIAMVNNTAAAIRENSSHGVTSDCPEAGDVLKDGPFDWDKSVRGILLSSYFIGYVCTPIPGGILAEKYSAKWMIFGGVLLNMIACVLIPPLAKAFDWGSIVAMRILEGAGGMHAVCVLLRLVAGTNGDSRGGADNPEIYPRFGPLVGETMSVSDWSHCQQGVTFPAMHVMLSKWAPPAQRSIFAGIVYAGTAIGTVSSILLAGYASVAIGWEWVFYILAMICFPWLVLWGLWVHDSPRRAIFISYDERISILKSQHGERKEEAPLFPYRSVATSKAFWAILIGHIGGNCGLYMIITQTPSFLKSVLHIPMKTLTSLSAIPYVFMYIFSVMTGLILDYFRKNKGLSTKNARRIAAAITMLVPALMLILLANVGCNWMFAVSVITVAVASIGAQSCAYLANHIDIAPNFAGVLMGITNTIATISGIIIPPVMGVLTYHHNTLDRWAIMFYTIAVIEIVCYTIFAIFLEGSILPWNAGRKWEKRQRERKKRAEGGNG